MVDVSIKDSTLYQKARSRFIWLKSVSGSPRRLFYENFAEKEIGLKRPFGKADDTRIFLIIQKHKLEEGQTFVQLRHMVFYDKERLDASLNLNRLLELYINFSEEIDPTNCEPDEYFDSIMSWGLRNDLTPMVTELVEKGQFYLDDKMTKCLNCVKAVVAAVLDDPLDAIIVVCQDDPTDKILEPMTHIVGLWAMTKR